MVNLTDVDLHGSGRLVGVGIVDEQDLHAVFERQPAILAKVLLRLDDGVLAPVLLLGLLLLRHDERRWSNRRDVSAAVKNKTVS